MTARCGIWCTCSQEDQRSNRCIQVVKASACSYSCSFSLFLLMIGRGKKEQEALLVVHKLRRSPNREGWKTGENGHKKRTNNHGSHRNTITKYTLFPCKNQSPSFPRQGFLVYPFCIESLPSNNWRALRGCAQKCLICLATLFTPRK